MRETVKTDLSKIEGTYTKAIVDNLPRINEAYNNKHVSSAEFKSLVLEIVNTAKPTKGQKLFVFNMSKKQTKDQILYYLYESELNGSKLGTKL